MQSYGKYHCLKNSAGNGDKLGKTSEPVRKNQEQFGIIDLLELNESEVRMNGIEHAGDLFGNVLFLFDGNNFGGM